MVKKEISNYFIYINFNKILKVKKNKIYEKKNCILNLLMASVLLSNIYCFI